MKIDGVSAIAVVLILSFAINRIALGLLFLLSFVKPWARFLPDPVTEANEELRIKAEKKRKLSYFILASILSMGVFAGYGTVRILAVSGFPSINPILDVILTGLILVAGSDRIGELLKTPATAGAVLTTAEAPTTRPIEITGTLTLVEPKDQREGVAADKGLAKAAGTAG